MVKCHKWIKIPRDKLVDYDAKIINCKTCKIFIAPFFIHDEYGDYSCFICNESGELKYFCMNCKN